MYRLHTTSAALKRAIRSSVVEPAAFAVGVWAAVLNASLGFGILLVLFGYSNDVGGWSFNHAAVLYGLYIAVDGFAATFLLPGLSKLPEQIKSGEFDTMLLSPAGETILMTAGQANFWRVPDVIVGLTLAAINMPPLGVLEFGLLSVSLIGAFAFLIALWWSVAAFTIFAIRLENSTQLIVVPLSLGRFPLSAYPDWLRVALFTAIPVAFITVVPASSVFEGSSRGLVAIGFVGGLLAAFCARTAFKTVVARYTGV